MAQKVANPIATTRSMPGTPTERARPFHPVLQTVGLFLLIVVTVTVVGVMAGIGGAVVTGLLAVVVVGIAFGLWGAALAVKDNERPGPHEHSRAAR